MLQAGNTMRIDAIKILSAHATKVQGSLANELDILRCINSNNTKAHPGRKHLTTLLDNFTVTDHHGPHLCLVSEASGAFKGPIYDQGRNLLVPFVKNLARQLLLALDFLHRECGIIHTGTLPYNLLYLNSDHPKRPQTRQFFNHASQCWRSNATVHNWGAGRIGGTLNYACLLPSCCVIPSDHSIQLWWATEWWSSTF